jgi:anti-sigma regulatory factor (Ser/Thr protein kinase)
MSPAPDPSVRLIIPARSRYLRLARLTAAGIASDLGFSLQGIEDLRVAVDEACAMLIDGCGSGDHELHELELHYGIVGDKLLIEGSSRCGAGEPIDMHPVALELLEMTADEHEIVSSDAGRVFRLVKHRQDVSV